ncbi:MAG: hypothetical protein H0T41_00715, partial [Rhodobacteraceae bacterium]|nr:hypothetical protein [Paracoccaceae bacterium]
MGSIVPFAHPCGIADRRQIEAAARQLIEELGDKAGHSVGVFARSPSLKPPARARLLAVVDEIERQQGFGWRFGDDRKSSRRRPAGRRARRHDQ